MDSLIYFYKVHTPKGAIEELLYYIYNGRIGEVEKHETIWTTKEVWNTVFGEFVLVRENSNGVVYTVYGKKEGFNNIRKELFKSESKGD